MITKLPPLRGMLHNAPPPAVVVPQSVTNLSFVKTATGQGTLTFTNVSGTSFDVRIYPYLNPTTKKAWLHFDFETLYNNEATKIPNLAYGLFFETNVPAYGVLAGGTTIASINTTKAKKGTKCVYIQGTNSNNAQGVNASYFDMNGDGKGLPVMGAKEECSVAFWANSTQHGFWNHLVDIGDLNAAPAYGINRNLCVSNSHVSNELIFQCMSSNGAYGSSTTAKVGNSSNVWSHYVFTMTTGGVLTRYVDGAVFGSTLGNYWFECNNTKKSFLMLGKSAWPDPCFNGYLDDFRLYNTVLSADEVKTLYAMGNATSGEVYNNTVLTPTNVITGLTAGITYRVEVVAKGTGGVSAIPTTMEFTMT